MDILKDFFSKFIILVLVISCIIFLSSDEKDITSNKDDAVDNSIITNTNKEIKKGSFISAPKQEKVSTEALKVDIGGIKVTLTKLAKYDITGIVMDTEQYKDVVGPVDVALAWGKLAEDYNFKELTSYVVKNRTLTWKTNDAKWIEKMGGPNRCNK